MKECPICHTQYEDSLNFCVKDGHQLDSIIDKPHTASTQNAVNDNTLKSSQMKQNKGCLKKIAIVAIVGIVALILLYNHLVNAATYLRTEPAVVQVTKGGGACKVDIDYDGYVWTVNHQPEWVYIDENDNDFEMNVEPNLTGQMREGSITIQSGKQLAQVVIRQNAFATYVRASETSLKIGRSGETGNIAIESDGCNWIAEYTDWMVVTKESDTELRIKCPNNTGEYRMGTITVREDNAQSVINVYQAGDCNNCHGSGEVSCNSCLGVGGMGFGMYYSSCMWCGGRGKIRCEVCGGSGVRE